MNQTRSAADVLERDFLEIRSKLLDLAAAFDRLDRAAGRDRLEQDPRFGQLRSALDLLREPGASRAEAVQLHFSDPYDPEWRRLVPSTPRLG